MVVKKYQGHFEEQKMCFILCILCLATYEKKKKRKMYNLIDCGFHLVQIFVFKK